MLEAGTQIAPVKISSLPRMVCSLESAVAFLAAISALCFAGGFLSLGDRVSHFAFYWALLSFGVAVWAAYRKRWILAAFGAVLFLIHAVPVASMWLPSDTVSQRNADSATLTIVSANLYASNRRKADAIAKLLELSPDLLVLMEVGSDWRRVLGSIVETYPHSLGTGGTVWLLSRHPLRQPNLSQIKSPDYPETNTLMEATIVVRGSPIRVVAIHGPRPIGRAGIAHQRRLATPYRAALARDPEASHQVLIGDFNTSPFSAVFRHIVQTTGLRDAAKGWGYHPTWGPRLPREPLLPWLGIPIDHAFVSDQVLVENHQVGKMPGADHRYQMLKLRF